MKALSPLMFEFSCLGQEYRIDFYRYHYKILTKEADIWNGGLALVVAGLSDDPRVFRPITVEPSSETAASLVHFAAAKAIKAAKKNRNAIRARSNAFELFALDLSCCKSWTPVLKLKNLIIA